MLSKIAIFTLLISISISQTLNCSSGMSASDLIQTGNIIATGSTVIDSDRYHSYTVPVYVYTVPSSGIQITASISGYLFSSSQIGFDFQVQATASKGNTSSQIILFINNDASWTKITISYIITSRTDLFLGIFSIPAYQLSALPNNANTYIYALQNWTAPTTFVSSTAQIAGFRTVATIISAFSLNSVIIAPATGYLTVNLTVILNAPLQLIFISYVWWLNSPAIQPSNFDPSVGSSSAYQFVGIGSLTNRTFSYSGIAFNGSGLVGSIPCVGSNCPSGCIGITACATQTGVVANLTCYLCGANQTYSNFQCNTVITCGQNQRLTGSTCSCLNGFFYVNATYCVKCANNGYWNNTACVCNFGYYSSKALCLPCPANSAYNSTTATCACDPSYNWVNGSCVTCSSNRTWSSAQQACVCLPGYLLTKNACLANCPPNAAPSQTGCACNPGYTNYSNVCVSCPPQSAYVQALQSCVCVEGLYLANGSCISCGANAYYNSSDLSCRCATGYYNISNVCSSCPNNTSWGGNSCVCNQGYVSLNGICSKCGNNQVVSGNTCVCLPTFTSFAGVCSCPLNSQLTAGQCVCNQGSSLVNGICVTSTVATTPVCPSKAAWNGTKCVCIPGFNLINGTCQTCQVNSTFDAPSQKCFCNPGFYGDTTQCYPCDSSCKTCRIGGVNGCLTCKNGYKLSPDKACLCNQGKDGKDGKGKDGCR